MKVIEDKGIANTYGMLPTGWNLTTGKPDTVGTPHMLFLIICVLIAKRIADYFSVGAYADSGHEYLLKLYLLNGRTDKSSLELCSWYSFLI